MQYELQTETGVVMEFLVRECAEVFRNVHGGVIIEVNNQYDEIETSEPSEASSLQRSTG